MIYIVSALYSEAAPIIAHMKKEPAAGNFQIFSNDHIRLILSNPGLVSSAIATTYLLTVYPPSATDYICNLGCAASAETSLKPGDIFLCHDIENTTTGFHFYPDMLLTHPWREARLATVSRVYHKSCSSANKTNPTACIAPDLNTHSDAPLLIDMEGAGFFESARVFFSPDRILVLKLLSDYLDGSMELRDTVTALFTEASGQILEFFSALETIPIPSGFNLNPQEQKLTDEISARLYLSETMKHQFHQFMHYLKLSSNNFPVILTQIQDELLHTQFQHKREGKIYFEQLRQRYLK